MFVATLPRTIPLLLITVAMLGECSPVHPFRNKRNINIVMAVEGTGIPKGPWIQFLIGTSIYFGVTALLFIVTCCCCSVQKVVKQAPGQAAVSSVPGKPKPATRKIEEPQPQKQQLSSKTADVPSSTISGQPLPPPVLAGKPKLGGTSEIVISIDEPETSSQRKPPHRSGSKKTARGKSDRGVRPPSVHQPSSRHTARSRSSSSGSSSYSSSRTGSSYSSSGSSSGSESGSSSSSWTESGSESSSGSSTSGSYTLSRTSSRGSRSGRSSSSVSRGSSNRGSRSSHSRSSRSRR